MPNDPQVLALMIPIVSIILGIGVAFWAIYWDFRTKQIKYRERELMIEKGLPIPPIIPDKKPVTPEDCLHRGIIMLFLGIGLGIGSVILLREQGGPPPWTCSIAASIIGLMGIGNLLYYFIARKRTSEDSGNDRKIIVS